MNANKNSVETSVPLCAIDLTEMMYTRMYNVCMMMMMMKVSDSGCSYYCYCCTLHIDVNK